MYLVHNGADTAFSSFVWPPSLYIGHCEGQSGSHSSTGCPCAMCKRCCVPGRGQQAPRSSLRTWPSHVGVFHLIPAFLGSPGPGTQPGSGKGLNLIRGTNSDTLESPPSFPQWRPRLPLDVGSPQPCVPHRVRSPQWPLWMVTVHPLSFSLAFTLLWFYIVTYILCVLFPIQNIAARKYLYSVIFGNCLDHPGWYIHEVGFCLPIE